MNGSPLAISPWRSARPVAALAIVLSISLLPGPAVAADDLASRLIGKARVFNKAGSSALSPPQQPPAAIGRSGAEVDQAAPTNQWYSSLLFGRWSQVLHAHPATYLAGAAGLEIGYPHRVAAEAGRHGVDITYPHRAALTLSPIAFQPRDARLSGHGDFSANIRMADEQGEALEATLVKGSPYSYFTLSRGNLRVQMAGGTQRCPLETAPEVLCVQAQGRRFALFGAPGSIWKGGDTLQAELQFSSSGRFLTVALLPDEADHAPPPAAAGDLAGVLGELQAHAYAFVTDTRVHWHYDPQHSRVDTEFSVTTQPKVAGANRTLLGVYPHQEAGLQPSSEVSGSGVQARLTYDSIRGPIRTVDGNSFRVAATYPGILPFWGPLQDTADRERLDSLLGGDAARARNLFSQQIGRGTYWYGKALSATAQLMCVAEQAGNTSLRNAQLTSLRERLEHWFRGDNRSSYFVQDASLGTLLGYPDEYGSIAHINDHHFHYGYWLNAAAQVALRDPAWAANDQWGGIVNLMVADIATAERGRRDFPFLRNFDVYEGHSWASGDADSADGNNQESSSEAINAWAGLILWAEATHNPALRDLGIWLYTTEIGAIATYWFDTRQTLFPAEYGGRPVAAQVFGGRYAYNTWWTEEPRQILGINLIPITPASLYLGKDPAYVRRFASTVAPEVKTYRARGGSDGTPDDVWQDIHASFLALADPAQALTQWRPRGSAELGETRSHTLYWLLSLKEMGTADFTVTADTTLYGVFRQTDGQRTYLAYNAGSVPLHVTFSDGRTLDVASQQLGRMVVPSP